MNKEAVVLKSDGAGRVLTPVARQEELMRELKRSGLYCPLFAELAGIRYQSYATWRRSHGAQGPAREECRPGFLEVADATPKQDGSCFPCPQRPILQPLSLQSPFEACFPLAA